MTPPSPQALISDLVRVCDGATTPEDLTARAAPTLLALSADDGWTAVGRAIVAAGLARQQAENQLADLAARVDDAQGLANMGDYDWHIADDTNRWSDQLYRIYGHEPQSFNVNYEWFLTQIHPDDRARVQEIHQQAYATGEPYEMVERIVRPDGQTRYLSSNGQVVRDAAGTPVRMRGTCIDITERVLAEQEREDAAARLNEVQLRRRQALEINDNIVQGLTAAALAMDLGDLDAATGYLERTLSAARHMMNGWLEPRHGAALRPGDLMRASASTLDYQAGDPPPKRCRILVADDSREVRELLRVQLESLGGYEVVGEAGDGEAAVRAATELQPEVVLLDLSMPRMDGLAALPLILAAVAGVRVIVMSGFDQREMAEQVLAAGAVYYVEKGLRMNLPGVIEGVLRAA